MADKFSFDLRRIKQNSFFLDVMRDMNNRSKRYSNINSIKNYFSAWRECVIPCTGYRGVTGWAADGRRRVNKYCAISINSAVTRNGASQIAEM
jgi:hypothetical protein